MHSLTLRAVLAALVILAGTALLHAVNYAGWCILLLITVALLLISVDASKVSRAFARRDAGDDSNEIGHANVPPDFSADSAPSANRRRQQ